MSDSSFRGITPVTARSSMVPESVTLTDAAASHYGAAHRKIRLRVVTRHPLPEFHFLAPFDPHDLQCFAKLQSFVQAHMVTRSRRTGQTAMLPPSISPEALQFQMDNFEVPFDDPEILRDGDTIEVHLDQSAVAAVAAAEAPSAHETTEAADDGEAGAHDDEEQQSDAPEDFAPEAEEREAILEAHRLAALLRAGVHTLIDDDGDDVSMQQEAVDNLPRMPASSSLPPHQAQKPSKSTSSKPPKASTSHVAPSLPLPPMPMSFGQGSAAAMAAFEAKRKQMQAASSSKAQKPVAASTKRSSPSSSSEDFSSSDNSSSSSDSDSSSSSAGSSSTGTDSDSESDSESDSSDASSESSDSSGSSSSSNSAPSEHGIQSDRHMAGARQQVKASNDSERSPSPTPPGQGTNRTKRRNQMRRQKLQVLRDAENLLRFEQAKDRAARRERGEDVDSGLAWIEDREPMLQIKGVGLAVANALQDLASSTTDGGSLPPGGGSFGLAEPTVAASQNESSSPGEAHKGTKRKRNGETASAIEDAAAQPPAPRVEDMQPGQAPYGGEVPEGISIRHIDCQTYYDEEFAKLEAEAEAEEASSSRVQDAEQADDGSQRQRGNNKKKGKHRHLHHEDRPDSQDDVFELDYGLPEATTPDEQPDEAAPRKKVKVDPDDAVSIASIISAHADATQLVPLGSPTRRKPGPIDPAVAWMKLLGATKPATVADTQTFVQAQAEWHALRAGMGLVWQALALDPVTRTPAVLKFVGIVESVDFVDGEEGIIDNVQVDVMGPLEVDGEKDWPDYEVERVTWTNKSRPAEIWPFC